MPNSILTSKGQTTIPKSIREQLQLKPADRILFSVEGGRVFLQAKHAGPNDLFGKYRHRRMRRPVSVETMKQAIKRKAKELYSRDPHR